MKSLKKVITGVLVSIMLMNMILLEAFAATTPLRITSQPENVNAAKGSNAVFTVTAEGGEDLTYQWQQLKPETGSVWTGISSYEGCETYEMTVIAYASRDNYAYRCVVTDKDGNSVISESVMLRIVSGVNIILQPQTIDAAKESNAVFSIMAEGDGLTYQWQQLKPDQGSTWTGISSYTGCRTNTMTVAAYASRNNYKYRCVVTDAYGNSKTSDAAELRIVNGVKITSQPQDVSAAKGSNAIFTITAEGSGLTYQWQQLKTDQGSTWTNISSYEGSRTNTMAVLSYASRDGYRYRCIVKDTYGNSLTSDEAALTAVDGITFVTDLQDGTVKLGEIAELKIEAEGDQLSYQWQVNAADGNGWVNITDVEGSTSDKLRITTDASVVNKVYRCVVTDTYGNIARSLEGHINLTVGNSTVISVVDFGANGKDEIADNKSIQDALDFAGNYATEAVKITVTIPVGIYYIEKSMKIFSNTILQVDSKAELILSGGANIFLAAGDGTNLNYDTFKNITISGGIWNANAAKNGLKTQPFAIKSGSNITIKDATFSNSADHCIMLTGVNGAVIENCVFKDMQSDLTVEEAYTKEALHIDFLELDEGILPTKNVKVKNCIFDNVATGLGTHNGNIRDHKIGNVEVSGCTFKNISYNCINGTAWSGGYIHDNKMSNTPQFLWSNLGTSVVENNDISCTGKRAFSIGTESNIQIIGNKINMVGNNSDDSDDETLDDETNIYNVAIWVNNSNVVINENTINNVSGMGIRIGNESVAEVNGNTLNMENDVAISVADSEISMQENTISALEGIKARYCKVANVNSNKIVTKNVAVSLYVSSGEVISNNIVSDTTYGIYVVGEKNALAKATVTHNTVKTNSDYDICIHEYTKDNLVAYNNANSDFSLKLATWADAEVYENGKNPTVRCPEVSTYVGANYVYLKWNAISSANVYRVFRVDPKTGHQTGLAKLSDTSYFIDNLEPNTEYQFIVLSYDSKETTCYYTYTRDLIVVKTKGNDKISISTQPKSSVTGIAGETAEIKVSAGGEGLVYQWQYCTPKNASWNFVMDFEGFNSSKLVINPVTMSLNNYKYRCIISDAHGNSVATNEAVLTVISGISITTQPKNVVAPSGSDAIFNITAEGEGLTYQWQQLKTDQGSTWTSISSYAGSKTDSMIVPVYSSRNEYKYRCVVTDKYGSSVTSNAGTLTIGIPEIAEFVITTQPKNIVTPKESEAIFSVVAKGEGLTYQWQQLKTDQGSAWTSISSYPGSKTDKMTVVAYASRNGYKYRCIVKDENGASITSSEVTLTMGNA